MTKELENEKSGWLNQLEEDEYRLLEALHGLKRTYQMGLSSSNTNIQMLVALRSRETLSKIYDEMRLTWAWNL